MFLAFVIYCNTELTYCASSIQSRLFETKEECLSVLDSFRVAEDYFVVEYGCEDVGEMT